MTDIKLPPLPPLHIAPSVEPCDYPDVAKAMMDYAREAVQMNRRHDHPAHVHCENCGCTWLDDGLNPIGCPYCQYGWPKCCGYTMTIDHPDTWEAQQ